MDKKKGYEKLKIWEKAHDFAKKIYNVTAGFPKSELYGLTSQLRRASLSVPVNIVEGYSRRSRKEFLNFLNIAYGSLNESEYLLRFAFENKFLSLEQYQKISGISHEIGAMLWAFMKQL